MTHAGVGLRSSSICCSTGLTHSSNGRAGAASGCPASRNRCRRSFVVSLSAPARLSSTCREGCTSRPCSNQTYQEVPILASCATSSRRSPGVRRRIPGGNPTSVGARLARRLRKKSARARFRSLLCISASLLTWWSQTYDQETLVLVSEIHYTQKEHPRQDGIWWREDGSRPGSTRFFFQSTKKGGNDYCL